MARTSWFDDDAQHPLIHEQIEKLESFTSALADGQVSKQELSGQEQRLVAALKALEPELSDEPGTRDVLDASRHPCRVRPPRSSQPVAGRRLVACRCLPSCRPDLR